MKYKKTEVLMILGIAALSAVLFNAFSSKKVNYIYKPQQETQQPSVKQIISAKEAKKLVDDKKVLFIDARPDAIYKRGHIPGAINVPYNSKDKEEQMAKIKKNKEIVVYCYSARCNQARMLFDSLAKIGYTNLLLFNDGIMAWTKAGYPVEKSEN